MKNLNVLPTVAVLLLIFAIMFALNQMMPLHRDDYDYSMIWKTGEHIGALSDVIESTWRHYLMHGGRMFTVFCLNLFLWLGKFPFDVANALMFVALVILITMHARREFNFWDAPKLLAAVGLLTWLSLPHFGEVAIWKSGSTVYLWSAVPVALFLLPYNLKLAGRLKISAEKFFTAGMFLLGIIAGCSVENLAVTATLISLAAAVYCYRERIFEMWLAAGFFGNLLGLFILLAAPGNFVRYDEQGSGKGILQHIGNQFAGNAEMLLYILPVILLLICAYRILKSNGATTHEKRRGGMILPIVTIIFVVSYFCDSLITTAIHNFCVNVIFPLFNPSEKFIARFGNTMAKSEEMIIYLLIIFIIYLRLKNALGIANAKGATIFDVWQKFPQIHYGAAMFALALFNNFVMVAAPTFPARATFSSVVMILIGAISILRLPIVQKKFAVDDAGRILKLGALAIGGFTIISALVITHSLRVENDIRVAEVARAAEKKSDVVEFAPIQLKNRALRHVFFVDFDNGVTKDGLCEFYGIKNILVR